MPQTTDRIHAPLRAFACHPHTTNLDLCFPDHQIWLVLTDPPDDDRNDVPELLAVIPFTQAPDAAGLRKFLRVCDYRGDLTVDDA